MPNKKLCNYYREESKRCLVGYCKKANLCVDGSCKVNGKIQDLFKERNITNYDFKKANFNS